MLGLVVGLQLGFIIRYRLRLWLGLRLWLELGLAFDSGAGSILAPCAVYERNDKMRYMLETAHIISIKDIIIVRGVETIYKI